MGADEYKGIGTQLETHSATSAVVAVKRVKDPWQGAAVYEEQGRMIRIVEKPARGASTTPWDSAGLYGFRASIFDQLAAVTPSPRGEYELTSALENQLAVGLRLEIYEIKGPWCDVGRPEDLAEAERIVEAQQAPRV